MLTEKTTVISTRNNTFDFIRLALAIQVFVFHIYQLQEPPNSYLQKHPLFVFPSANIFNRIRVFCIREFSK